VGVEHHLLCLARIAPHEQHPTVTEPDMGGLHDHVTPLTRTTHWLQSDTDRPFLAQSSAGHRPQRGSLRAPCCHRSGVTAHGVVTDVIPRPELAEDPDLKSSRLELRERTWPRSLPAITSSSAAHRPSLGARLGQHRSYSNEVSPTSAPSRTVFRDTFRSRAISVDRLALMKCSAVSGQLSSTISIPTTCFITKPVAAQQTKPVGGQLFGLGLTLYLDESLLMGIALFFQKRRNISAMPINFSDFCLFPWV